MRGQADTARPLMEMWRSSNFRQQLQHVWYTVHADLYVVIAKWLAGSLLALASQERDVGTCTNSHTRAGRPGHALALAPGLNRERRAFSLVRARGDRRRPSRTQHAHRLLGYCVYTLGIGAPHFTQIKLRDGV